MTPNCVISNCFVLFIVAIVAVSPEPWAIFAPPTGPKINVSASSYAFPSDVTVSAVQNPTLLTVNWKPDPPPPPTVASSTLRTSPT